MEPTIEPGDRILANRLVRGDDVHRGDIVVFDGTRAFPVSGEEPSSGALATLGRTLAGALTLDTGTDYVKRVIGLPGDRVTCCDASGHLQVNGVGVDEPTACPATLRATSPSTFSSPQVICGSWATIAAPAATPVRI